MGEHVSAATRFRETKVVHDFSFHRFVRVGFAKINGVGRFAYLSNFFLKVSILVGKDGSAREALDGDNHLLLI
jgi:hypothetical protein